MDKKYIIAVVIGIAIWAGFMAFRHHKKQRDTSTYFEKMNRQVTDAAKKAPRAGLVEVGTALQGYYNEHKAYPSRLMDLVPDYLANKSLIQEIDWHYQPKGNNFLLTKTLLLGEKRIVASIDKGLSPQADAGVMIASPMRIAKTKAVKGTKTVEKVELSSETRLALARENLINALQRGAFNVASVSLPDRDEERLIAAVMPKVISESQGTDLESELSQRYLVWKGNTGVLGFSNVQYPDMERLAVFVYGRWFDVKMPVPAGDGSVGPETGKPDLEVIAAKLKDAYLVWKDNRGTLGFGNVQYPERHLSAVFQADAWLAVETGPFFGKAVSDDKGEISTKKSLETIATEIGNHYLVWKDNEGTVGFGNVQYPEKGLASVLQSSEWIAVSKPLIAPKKNADNGQGMPEKKSSEMLASEFGRQFLVWKHKNGTLGFGNVQYPDEGVDSVFDVDSWIDAKQTVRSKERDLPQGGKASDQRSPESVATAFSTSYLVWQDKRGTLGFGNVQYPRADTISGVHVNGSWESVAN